MKLEKDLYVYLWQNAYENNCNTYVIRGEKTALIDPGHSRHIKTLFHQMEGDGISPGEIEIVILTHSHPDHLEGLEAFVEKSVRIAMSRDEERYLMGNGKLLYEMMGQTLPKFRIDFYLGEGELHLGKETFQIYQTPGHSPGSLSIFWPERRTLFTGDLLFYGGVGRTDFPEGDSKLLMESIERLSELDTEILLPGHGDIVKGKERVLENFEFIRQNFYAYL
ncbi:MAG: MBL fold metallo-hydrolase [Syntrophaceae bacterium]|nr:MBL fold metallo-hydrolase [Syntrophaceae bacterium]